MGVARRSLRAQLTASAAYAIGGATGAILGGALGASWGVTAAQVLLRAGVVASASVGTGRSPRGGGGGQVTTTPAVPRLTLGLPAYNGERFLAESLDALLAQTFTDFELIISDNGSTDRTG